MKSKLDHKTTDEESTLSRLLGPAGGDRPEQPPYAEKMGIQDALIEVHVRVFGRHRLIFEFKRAAIHEGFFSKSKYHLAAHKFARYFRIITEVMHEQFLRALRTIFGWYVEPGRPRQEQLIFILPEKRIVPNEESSKGDPAHAMKQVGKEGG